MQFHDGETQRKVEIPEPKITKVKFTQKNGQVRYGLRGYTEDGRPLTKLVTKAAWDQIDASVVEEYSENLDQDILNERARRGSREKFLRALGKMGNAEPDEQDKL